MLWEPFVPSWSSALRNRSFLQHHYGFQEILDHITRSPTLDLGLGADDEPMAQNALSDGLHVGMGEIVSSVEHGASAGAAQQAQRGSRAGPETHVGMIAARLGEIDDVLEQRLGAVDLVET